MPAYVYIIVVFNWLHQQQAILPGSFPDLNSCKAQVVQTHVTLGNYAECTPLAYKPAAKRR